MSLFKHIRRTLPLVAGLFAAVLLCGAGGQSCDANDIDRVFDPENFDTSDRPLEGTIEIREIIQLRRGTDKEEMMPSLFGDDFCLSTTVLLRSTDVKEIKAIPIEKQKPYYSLELKLTDRGKRHWIGLSLPNRESTSLFLLTALSTARSFPACFTTTSPTPSSSTARSIPRPRKSSNPTPPETISAPSDSP